MPALKLAHVMPCAIGAVALACLDIAPAESPGGTGGTAGGSAGGAAGWPTSGGTGATTGGGGTGATAGGGGAGATTSGGGGGGASGAFQVSGIVFDGDQDWLELGAPFQGVSDTTSVTGSLWLKGASAGKTHCIGPEGAGSGSPNQLELTSSGSFRVVWRKAGGGVACDLLSANIDPTSWHHVVFSLDLSNPSRRHLYLDGASSLTTLSWNDTLLDNTGSQWGLFADNGGDQKFKGEVAELWLALGAYLDLSQASNREKFRSAAGKPVDLGPNGQSPTGQAPTIYLSSRAGESAAAFVKNRGSGGGFWLHGALDIAATSPSN